MICGSCRKAAKLWNAADTRDSATGSLLYQVTELHGPDKCPGLTWCDCQHHVLSKPISP